MIFISDTKSTASIIFIIKRHLDDMNLSTWRLHHSSGTFISYNGDFWIIWRNCSCRYFCEFGFYQDHFCICQKLIFSVVLLWEKRIKQATERSLRKSTIQIKQISLPSNTITYFENVIHEFTSKRVERLVSWSNNPYSSSLSASPTDRVYRARKSNDSRKASRMKSFENCFSIIWKKYLIQRIERYR